MHPAQQPYAYPYAQSGGWGAPMAPPPRRGLSAGAIVGIVVGVVFGLPALSGVLLYVSSGGQGQRHHASSPVPDSERYRLKVPSALLDGQYTLAQDLSKTMDDKLAGERNGRNEHDMRMVSGQYTTSSGEEQETMLFAGSYGEIDDPHRALDSMLRGMSENEGVTVTTPAKEVTPPGAQTPVTCQVLGANRAGQSNSVVVCGWSDHSTVGTVSVPGDSGDFDAAAMKTLRIRNETRVRA
ncbi:hypothetical protein [Streptomyces hesseae]|uniref:Uncharacterized protein n=1 Tax=Streptomyces hesseae TaxID=3075519 RepID=A0ABU2SNH2_9ACTN|nr:hypothetical protein [Streptomyces sp. DSM 40473]MDT0450523.1 hypothetical protein [Streptomyces sp. DSM 40473]